MNTPDKPQAPDVTQTSDQQLGYNKSAAQSQAELNMVNQSTPYGSLTYNQTGTAADGTPQYTATTSFTPAMQSLMDSIVGTQGTMGKTASNLAGQIQSLYSQPFSADKATEDQLDSLARARLDPQIQMQQQQLQTQLTNQGVTPGSEAWNNAMRQFTQNSNDQYNQLYLTGNQQALQAALAQRQEPLNELMTLLGGSSPTNPTFTSTPQESIAAPNSSGLAASNYSGEQQQYAADVSANNALIGGLASLGGAALGGWTSGGLGKGFSKFMA